MELLGSGLKAQLPGACRSPARWCWHRRCLGGTVHSTVPVATRSRPASKFEAQNPHPPGRGPWGRSHGARSRVPGPPLVCTWKGGGCPADHAGRGDFQPPPGPPCERFTKRRESPPPGLLSRRVRPYHEARPSADDGGSGTRDKATGSAGSAGVPSGIDMAHSGLRDACSLAARRAQVSQCTK